MTHDSTAWKQVEGDHADDRTYERKPKDPTAQPTDEQRTTEEITETKKTEKVSSKK